MPGGRSHAQFGRCTKARKKMVPNQQTAATMLDAGVPISVLEKHR
jgi:hypothetical protein